MTTSEMLAPQTPGIFTLAGAALLTVLALAVLLRPLLRQAWGQRLHLAYKKTAVSIAGAQAWPCDSVTVAEVSRPLPEYETVC